MRWLFVRLLIPFITITAPLLAHEIGTTQVTATFGSNGTYRIEIVVDPENLLSRLQLLSKEAPSSGLSPEELQKQIEARGELFLSQLEIRFDDAIVKPALTYSPLPRASEAKNPKDVTALLRLEGAIPSNAKTFRWRYKIPYGTYALNLRSEGDTGQPSRQWLEGEAESQPFLLRERPRTRSRGETALLYLELGFTHIIPKGADHILFVLGIFLLSQGWRQLLAQVTAFTLAHSITLALTIYGLVSLPSRFVEAAIALSIAYVGFENVATRTVRPWRIALVFAFGLLHGMGFAGVLGELGLPRSEFATALIAFNVGVELGQLAVIALAFLLVASWARTKKGYREYVVVPVSLLIGIVGIYWTYERLTG